MDSIDIRSYKGDYLKSTRDDLDRLRKLLRENPEEVTVIHRLFHTIKGRSFFMGYHDIGLICLKAENKIDHNVKVGAKIDDAEIKELLKSVEHLEVLLEKI